MSGLLGSGMVNPDSQPPSPWSHVLPPPPNPPPPPWSPWPAVSAAAAAARRAALSPGDVVGGGLPRAPPVESGAPVLSRAPAPRPRCCLTLFCPASGALLGPRIVPLSCRLL